LEKTPKPKVLTRTTILLVEERDLGTLLRNLLRSSGYRVLTCTTGKTAMQVCQRLNMKIDIVLTAFVLPDTDGVSLAVHLRTQYPPLKIMGMSAAPSSGEKFTAAGVPFIEKPFHYAELVARLREDFQ
jgi:DNA-binding response OmpR family regulator